MPPGNRPLEWRPTTKIQALADGQGRPYMLKLTVGQVHDIRAGCALLTSVAPMRQLLANKAYDGSDLRNFLAGIALVPAIIYWMH